MLIAILAFVALAATAALVIRDAVPDAGARVVSPSEGPAPADPAGEKPSNDDAPTQAAVVGFPDVATAYDPSIDAPTESMPALMIGGGQAAAILPYPVRIDPEPAVAATVPAGADPERLIQTVVLFDEDDTAQGPALMRLAAGIAIAGGAVGLSLVGVGRAISALLGH
jgi:hypothetical protein